MNKKRSDKVVIEGRLRRPWALISRDKILDAAIAEIAERGYEKARLVDIAERAELTVGSIYNWYENKADLFKAALEHSMIKQQKVNSEYFDKNLPEPLKNNQSASWMVLIGQLAPGHGSSTQTDAQKLLLEALKASWRDDQVRADLQPQIEKILQQYEVVIKNAISAGEIDSSIDPVLLARLIFAFPIGHALLSLNGVGSFDPISFIPFFKRLNEALKTKLAN